MKQITILTPTYNRACLIKNLYNSLVIQTCKDFTWLVIDDGSTDNTKEEIQSYIDENKIDIKYIYQKNGGKYVAHNNGVKMCETKLIVCVDSDDELYSNAVERTLLFWDEIKEDISVAGIVSPRDMNGKAYFSNQPKMSSLMDLYNKKQLFGDTMLVFRTEVLKQNLFPEIVGENFMSECVVYNQIDQKYVMATQNEYLYKGEYQPEGLTKNIQKIIWKNPMTTLITYMSDAAFQKDFLIAAKSYGLYLAWKKVRNLESCNMYKIKPSVKIFGNLLYIHYLKLFKKQKENME